MSKENPDPDFFRRSDPDPGKTTRIQPPDYSTYSIYVKNNVQFALFNLRMVYTHFIVYKCMFW